MLLFIDCLVAGNFGFSGSITVQKSDVMRYPAHDRVVLWIRKLLGVWL
jgi:hypothetical protein